MKKVKMNLRRADKTGFNEFDAYPVTQNFWIYKSLNSTKYIVCDKNFGDERLVTNSLKAAKSYAQCFQSAYDKYPYSLDECERVVKNGSAGISENLKLWIEDARKNVKDCFGAMQFVDNHYQYRFV